jgi:hypothetical protein
MNFGTLNNYNDIFDALDFQIDHDNDATYKWKMT